MKNSNITDLKKTLRRDYPTVWRFKYNGVPTEVVEGYFNNESKIQTLHIIMQTENGRYFVEVYVDSELLTTNEREVLELAAKRCKIAYKKRINGT